ncbi:MAG: 4Fe-4S dicluster domain-containing protein [Candidatus Omnitrophica bacterium]|nr:4Fe-4S dicluster domain-containing protein [Candidatus Omnitrophota bacterium]
MIKKHRYIENVATLKVDINKCIGCGMCVIVCPHGVFTMEAKKTKIIDLNACMECGACALNCPVSVISVQSGVGCASGIIQGALNGTEPTCGCSGKEDKSCC